MTLLLPILAAALAAQQPSQDAITSVSPAGQSALSLPDPVSFDAITPFAQFDPSVSIEQAVPCEHDCGHAVDEPQTETGQQISAKASAPATAGDKQKQPVDTLALDDFSRG